MNTNGQTTKLHSGSTITIARSAIDGDPTVTVSVCEPGRVAIAHLTAEEAIGQAQSLLEMAHYVSGATGPLPADHGDVSIHAGLSLALGREKALKQELETLQENYVRQGQVNRSILNPGAITFGGTPADLLKARGFSEDEIEAILPKLLGEPGNAEMSHGYAFDAASHEETAAHPDEPSDEVT